jgi:hypothetical protein
MRDTCAHLIGLEIGIDANMSRNDGARPPFEDQSCVSKLRESLGLVLLPPGEGGAKRRMRGARPTMHQALGYGRPSGAALTPRRNRPRTLQLGQKPHRTSIAANTSLANLDRCASQEGIKPTMRACLLGNSPKARDYISSHHHAASSGADRSALGSSTSVIVASASSSVPATDAAFSSATRTTLVGSIIPASIRSTYLLHAASNP